MEVTIWIESYSWLRMATTGFSQLRGRSTSEWKKSAMAGPVTKERVELSRWPIRWLWALEGADGPVRTSSWAQPAVREALRRGSGGWRRDLKRGSETDVERDRVNGSAGGKESLR